MMPGSEGTSAPRLLLHAEKGFEGHLGAAALQFAMHDALYQLPATCTTQDGGETGGHLSKDVFLIGRFLQICGGQNIGFDQLPCNAPPGDILNLALELCGWRRLKILHLRMLLI